MGGEAERAYIAKTFQAVPYVVPQFLTTCEHTTKEDATNLGVRILPTRAAMLAEVARAACEHHRKVPVLRSYPPMFRSYHPYISPISPLYLPTARCPCS